MTNSFLVYTSNYTKSGFIFSPFNSDRKGILFPTTTIDYALYTTEKLKLKEAVIPSNIEGKQDHLKLVSKAITKIEESNLKKVVLSRKLVTQTQKDEFQLFKELLDTYSNAFKYLWFHPEVGTWLGATPEVLLEIKNKGIVTNSIAGTLPVVTEKKPNWTTKEIEEQEIVTRYILENLQDKLENIETTKASSVKAGKLWHLKSTITGYLKTGLGVETILKTLHPTPAICGFPKEKAINFIYDNEGYDREFYSGFLGELNIGSKEETNVYVNLRCMKFKDTKATIFVGGGITKDSDIEKEWEETQHKSKTMLNLL